MTPFLQVRLWVRKAPMAERIGVASAVLTVVALLALALVAGGAPGGVVAGTGTGPTGGGGARTGPAASAPGRVGQLSRAGPSTGVGASGGVATGQAPAGSGVPAASGGSGSSGAAGGSVAAGTGAHGSASPSPSGSPPCTVPAASGQGVTASEIRLAVVIPDIEGQAGNELFGVPPPQTVQAMYQTAIDDANRNGGVDCRKLMPTYYFPNPLDQSQEHSQCLQAVQGNPFAALDTGFSYSAPVKDCMAQAKIPDFSSAPLFSSEAHQYFPYAFSFWGVWDRLMRDYVLGSRQRGWFHGMKKVGVLEEDCFPELNSELLANLAAVGIGGSQLTTYDFGCPSGLAPPNEVEQAVLQFKTGGVTHVMDAESIGNENYFSKYAQQQGYRPKYTLPDGGAVSTYESPDFAPDPTNYNGALSITPSQYGAENTPGVATSAATQHCDRIMAAAGLPSAEKSPDAFSGVTCDIVSMFVAAAAHASSLTRTALVTGLDTSGSLDLSFPGGPGQFNQPGVVTGGQFWRTLAYDGSCPCFKVVDATFRPNF